MQVGGDGKLRLKHLERDIKRTGWGNSESLPGHLGVIGVFPSPSVFLQEIVGE